MKKRLKKRKYRNKKKQVMISHTHRTDFLLTTNNKLTYVYQTNIYGQMIEITCVSLEIQIEDKWKTVVYYDSTHNKQLHRHTYFSIETDTDVVDYFGVKKKGSQKRLLKWAIQDIKNNYLIYKKQFIKRCKEINVNLDIEIY